MSTHPSTTSAFVTALALALLLTASTPQEPDPPAPQPSLADAARAARERRSLAANKNILTNDDVAHTRGTADDAVVAALEAGLRTQIDASYPPNPTSADLERQRTQLTIYAKAEPPEEMFAKFEESAVHNMADVDFPGKKEWEAELNNAVMHWIQQCGEAAQRIEGILSEDREALANRDAAGVRKARAQWIDAVVLPAAWQARIEQLVDDGKSRVFAYQKDSSAALDAYRHARAASTEALAVVTLRTLQKEEALFKSARGQYTCDAAEFARPKDNPPRKPDANWTSGLALLNERGYHVELKDCDAGHFVGLAVPPAANGNDGRAFCTSELGSILVVPDGSPAKCPTQGTPWPAN
jgi:hypothetical protein